MLYRAASRYKPAFEMKALFDPHCFRKEGSGARREGVAELELGMKFERGAEGTDEDAVGLVETEVWRPRPDVNSRRRFLNLKACVAGRV